MYWYWNEKIQVNHSWWFKKFLFENFVKTSFLSDLKAYTKQTAGIDHTFEEMPKILNDLKLKHNWIAMINNVP